MLELILLSTFGAVVLFIVGITMKSERVIVRERIQRLTQVNSSDVDSVRAEMGLPLRDRIVSPFLRRLADAGNRITPAGAIGVLDAKLDSAGRPGRLGGKEFIGLKVLLALAMLVVSTLTVRLIHTPSFTSFFVIVLSTLIGYVAPDVSLSGRLSTRRSGIRKALADTLDLLTVSVEAGLGLDGAMQKVVEKQHGPLAEEMARSLQEMQLGMTRAEALRDMAHRSDVPELGTFVAALIQAEQLGVSISKILRIQGDTIRARRSQAAREMAAKLPVKLLFPLVFFIFPAIYVIVVAPGAVAIGRALGIIK